jgi:hypothetical protein
MRPSADTEVMVWQRQAKVADKRVRHADIVMLTGVNQYWPAPRFLR